MVTNTRENCCFVMEIANSINHDGIGIILGVNKVESPKKCHEVFFEVVPYAGHKKWW